MAVRGNSASISLAWGRSPQSDPSAAFASTTNRVNFSAPPLAPVLQVGKHPLDQVIPLRVHVAERRTDEHGDAFPGNGARGGFGFCFHVHDSERDCSPSTCPPIPRRSIAGIPHPRYNYDFFDSGVGATAILNPAILTRSTYPSRFVPLAVSSPLIVCRS